MFEDIEECFSFCDWFGIELNDDMFFNPDEVFDLIKSNSTKDDANLPKRTNKRFIENKKGNSNRKDVVL